MRVPLERLADVEPLDSWYRKVHVSDEKKIVKSMNFYIAKKNDQKQNIVKSYGAIPTCKDRQNGGGV